MMRSSMRLLTVVALTLGVLSIGAPSAHAFGNFVAGKPKSNPPPPEDRETDHEDENGNAIAEVAITGGPADETCITRGGRAVTESVTWETPVPPDVTYTPVYDWRDVPGAEPPRQELVQVGSDIVIVRRWKVLTLSCNGVPRQVRVCVPGPGQPETVCPPVDPPDGRAVALRNMRYLLWPDLNPQFAPDITGEGVGSFAITQAPMFFWFPQEDWDKQPTAQARACTAAGCLTATTVAVPIGVGMRTGVDDATIDCPGSPGTPVRSPSAYEAARRSNGCNQYTYRHSSTTVGGTYSAEVYMDYQIWIGSDDESRPQSSITFGPVDGNIYESAIEFDLRVGEIEGVVK